MSLVLISKNESNVLTATFKGSCVPGTQLICAITDSIKMMIYFNVNRDFEIKFHYGEYESSKRASVEITNLTNGVEYRLKFTEMSVLSGLISVPIVSGKDLRKYPLSQFGIYPIGIRRQDQTLRASFNLNHGSSNMQLGTEFFNATVMIMESVELKPRLKNVISSDLSDLLTEKKLTDFKFKVEEKEFNVHKSILAARSPVMMTMFCGEFKETKTGESSISDISSAVFEDFLRYLYTDSVETLNDHVFGLLQLAHRYEVNGLKAICESKLLSRINEENSEAIFQYAHLYNCSPTLKAKSFNVIKSSFAKNNYNLPDKLVDSPNEMKKMINLRKEMESLLQDSQKSNA